MTPREQDTLINNIMDNLMFVDDKIQKKVVSYFMNADDEFGAKITRGLDF